MVEFIAVAILLLFLLILKMQYFCTSATPALLATTASSSKNSLPNILLFFQLQFLSVASPPPLPRWELAARAEAVVER